MMSGTMKEIFIYLADFIETCIYEVLMLYLHCIMSISTQDNLFGRLLYYNLSPLGTYLIKIALLKCTTRGDRKKCQRIKERQRTSNCNTKSNLVP